MVGVAMSGGVDSSVTAALLQEQGYRVRGFFMALAQPDLAGQVEQVRQVADRLAIPLEVVDLAVPFRRHVLDYFLACYQQAKTPNPCVVCNRMIKAGLLLDHALAVGVDCLATGHYARIAATVDGRFHLSRGRDRRKDQSYFLCRLGQPALSRLIMPLGEYCKTEVYRLAADRGLAGVHGSESQDVCFLQDASVAEFLVRHGVRFPPAGPIVSTSGAVLGHHGGVHRFTVGQRRGLGLPDTTPYYVVALDAAINSVVVGKEADLWLDRLVLTNMNWMGGTAPLLPRDFLVQIRSRHRPASAVVELDDSRQQQCKIRFSAPQRAVTPGQFAVLYQGDEVIGSGEILG